MMNGGEETPLSTGRAGVPYRGVLLGEANMRMRWTWGVALVAGLVGQGGTALAQYVPSPVGATRIPEPLPCNPGPQPNLIPGPISPLAAPPGPGDQFSLTNQHSSAFQCETFPAEQAAYFHIGSQALIRGDRLGKGALAVLDPQNLDTGDAPPPGSQVLQRYKDISQNMNVGVRATVGYLFNDSDSIELTGFYIDANYNSIETNIAGQVDAFFHNAPLGFEGDNGLFLQADRLHTTFTQRIASGELNYRHCNKALTDVEVLFGVRYLDQRESLNIFTGDDDLTAIGVNGQNDPTLAATYLVETHNRIIAPQFGIEYAKGFTHFVTFGLNAKAALGVNLVEVTTKLNRNDGFVGFQNHRDEYSFGQVYDVGATIDFHLLERAKLRFGYTAMWLVGVATATDNLDFNLANPAGRKSNYGSMFYHGPMVELQFLF